MNPAGLITALLLACFSGKGTFVKPRVSSPMVGTWAQSCFPIQY